MASPDDPQALDAEQVPIDVFEPGTCLGRKYVLVRLLAQGGMGEVWVARNTDLETLVALKLIRRELQGAAATARLLREARAAAKLRHPSIVQVFDFGATAAGDPYIVMELLEGRTLRAVLEQRGAFDAVSAVRAMLPVAHALAEAHARGVVHRDLKPENVVVRELADGSVETKIVDFGIATLVARAPCATSSIGLVGTPNYMSPEQVLGVDGVDARADVWAFCVVLYELLVDDFVFDGADVPAIFDAVLRIDPPRLADRVDADAELSAIVARGLARDRDARWSSMSELGAALAAWLLRRGVIDDAGGALLRTRWPLARAPDPSLLDVHAELDVVPGAFVDAPVGRSASRPSGRAGARRSARAWLHAAALGLVVVGLVGALLRSSTGVGRAPAAASTLRVVAEACAMRAFGATGRAAARASAPSTRAASSAPTQRGIQADGAASARARPLRAGRRQEVDFGF